MYFRHLYYDENNNVISLELECDICSNRIEIELPDNNISEATDEYCVVNDGQKIKCKCGNYWQSGKVGYNNAPQYSGKSGYFNVINVSEQRRLAEERKQLNVPHCPTCNSTKVEKISTTKRLVSTGLFGLASSNIGKTMHCKNCGYKW